MSGTKDPFIYVGFLKLYNLFISGSNCTIKTKSKAPKATINGSSISSSLLYFSINFFCSLVNCNTSIINIGCV